MDAPFMDKLPPIHVLFAIPIPPDITKAPLPVDVESTVDVMLLAKVTFNAPPTFNDPPTPIPPETTKAPVLGDDDAVVPVTVNELHDIPPATDTAVPEVLATET